MSSRFESPVARGPACKPVGPARLWGATREARGAAVVRGVLVVGGLVWSCAGWGGSVDGAAAPPMAGLPAEEQGEWVRGSEGDGLSALGADRDPGNETPAAAGLFIVDAASANPIPVAQEGGEATFPSARRRITRADVNGLAAAGNDQPAGMWSDGATIWVSDHVDGKLYAYDLASGSHVPRRDIDVSGVDTPTGVWSDGATIWVLSHKGGAFAYELATGNRAFAEDRLGVGGSRGLALWSDGETAWVAAEGGELAAYDWATEDRLPGRDFNGLADASNTIPWGLWSDGATMWIPDGSDGRIYAYDMTTRTRAPELDYEQLDAAGNYSPRGVWSDGHALWVGDWRPAKIYAYGRLAPALEALELSDADVGAFHVYRTDYVADVGATVQASTVTATARGEASVDIVPADSDEETLGHQIDLSGLTVGEAVGVRITVRDSGTALSRTYRVEIHRPDSDSDATLSALSLSGVDLGTFDRYRRTYAASVPYDVGETTVVATPARGGAVAHVLPADADILTEGHQVALAVGVNVVEVEVSAADGQTQRTYVAEVRRRTAAESTARLTTLSLDGIDIGTFSGHTYNYIGGVAEGFSGTTLTATPINGASFSVSPPDADGETPGHQIVMGQDVQQLTAVVTVRSGDGLTTREYRVSLHRAVVRFEDANLGAAVASALGKDPASALATADLAGLRTLDLSRVEVDDLGGLEFATHLGELFLGTNRVADLSPLDGLTVRVRYALAPGVGNVVWTADEVWSPVGALGVGAYSQLGYGVVFMADGHLAAIRALDGSAPQRVGNKELFSARQAVVEVWDVSDPRYPVRVKVYRNEDTHRLREAHSVGLWNRAGRVVLAAQSHDGVAFFDVTEIRTRLTLLAELDITGVEQGDYGGAWWVGVQAPYVYVAAVGGGLYVVDAADPSAPRVVNHLATGKLGGVSPGSVFPVGNLLVVGEPGNRGYATMDISDPANPALIEVRDGASGYSHLFTAGLLLTPGGVNAFDVRSGTPSQPGAVLGGARRMFVHRVGHDGRIAYVGEAGEGLGDGGYGSYQDGYFFAGFSKRVAKFTIDPPALVGSGTSYTPGRDEDFAQPLGNLIFAGNDHDGSSALIPHQAEPDKRGPEVVWMHPADGATGVAATSRVGVSMSDQVAAESLVATSFRVRPRGGEPVSGQLSVNQNNVNFSPDTLLADDTVYEVEVCGLADLVGNLGGCTGATFTTGGAGPAAPSCSIGLLAPAVAGTEVSYEAASVVGVPTSYEWHFGDGQRIGPQESGRIAVTHAAPGRLSATLTISNEHGTGSCGGVRVVHAAVTANAPAASSSIVVTGSVSEVDGPDDVDSWRGNTDIYMANPDAGTVTRLDNEHVGVWETAVGEAPRTLAVAPDGEVWVAVEGDGDIVVLNPAGELVRRIDLGYGAAPYGVVFAPDGRSAYVTVGGAGRLLRLSPTGATTGSLALSGQPRGIAVSGDSARIFATRFVSAFAPSGAKGEIYEVDAATFTLTRTHALAFDAGPDSELSGRGVPNYLSQARIAPDGGTLWVPSKKDNIARGALRDGNKLDFETQTRAIVSQVDLTTNTEALARRIDFNDRDLAQSLVFTPLGDAFVVAFQGSNVIEVWDANTLTRLSEVNVGRAPMGMAFRANGRRLYVHNFLDRSVTVLNTAGLLDGTVNQPLVVETVSTVAEEPLAAQVLRGKRLFYNAADRRMNRDGYISCASCHLDGGSDGMVWDRTQFGEGLRNTIDLRGRRGTNGGFVHWSANFDEIQDFENDIREAFGGSGFMSAAEFGTGTRSDPLGDAKAGVSAELDALAAYVASLDETPDSPHRAADGSLTAAAGAGKAVFESQGCARCHSGGDFTDDATHDVGTIRTSSGTDLTGINTPTLKGLWLGAPYLHDGSAATLGEVLNGVAHMGAELTGRDKEQLEAYLLQIDDNEPAPRALSTDASLTALTLSGVDIGTFSGAVRAYRASVVNAVAQTTVTATPTNARATVQVTPADADANTIGDQVALAVGANEITLRVTAEDRETTRSYTVTVTRLRPPLATLAAVTDAVSEGGAATFTVTLDRAPDVSMAVAVRVEEDGDMLSGLPPTALAVGAGETSATLEVRTADDRVSESDSLVTATLSAGLGYALGARTSATVTVADDDEPDFEVTAEPSEIEEGEAATVTVSVTNGVTYAEDKTVSLTVTGVSAEDYMLTPTVLTLASGESALTATLTATTDGVAEEAETARVEATLDGAVVGSVSVTVTDPPAPPLPVIEGVVQVGATLKAVFEQAESPDVAYQWLRDGEEIAGATGLSYAPTVSDVGRTVSVRVGRRGVSRTSAPTGLVWAAPSNPPLTGGEVELLGTVLTLEAAEGLLLDIAGFGHFWDERFGSLTRGDFAIGATRYTVTAAAVNNQGRFVLGTSPHLTGTEGLAVYWNGHRMGSFEETTLVGERYWETAVTQPKHEYKRYWNGASDGVRVALSIRRTAPVPTASIAADAATVGEGAAAAYTVTVDEAPRTDLAVSVSVTDEAAVLVSAAPSTVTVAAGAMSATLTLATDDDTVDEADGTVTVDLVSGAGYDLGAATSATVSVTDDDVATFAVTAEPVEIVEGGTSTVTVSATNGVTFAADVGIDLAVTGVSASDYELAPAEASLPAGETRVTAILTAVADEEEEGSETATVTARVDGAAVGSAAVTVRDASEDASLAALALSDVDIGAFDAEVTAYTAEVPHGIGTTTVQATPTDANASVELTDAVGSTLGTERTSTLTEGANEIAAQVTAEDRATRRTYAVTVTRAAPPPAWGARLPGRDITLADASAPSGVWSDGETVWVTDRYEVVRAYALSDGGRLPDRDLDVGSDSSQSALWSDGETLWVGDYYGGVLAHRLSDGARLASRDLDLETLTEAGNDRPTGLWSDGETLWVADNEDAHVYAYGVSGGARAEGQEFGLRKGDVKTGWPWGVWSDGDTALVSWYRRGKVYAYRLSGGARYGERDIDTGGSGNADPQGLWSDGETLWVVDGADRKLYAYAVPGLRRIGGVLPDLVLTNRAEGVPGTDPGAPVSIPDAGLRGRIGVALGKAPEELIGANELAALTALDARDAGVRDLTGLEHAVRLTGLDLGLNPVVDVRALALLPALATLNLDGTLMEPWSLAGLTGLERLSLRDNGIEDLAGLSMLTSLRVLDVGGNRIADLTPLAGLASLTALRADDNAIGDLSPLSGLEKLTTLDLRDNAIEDASPLAALGELVEVDLRGNRIADFSALDGNRRLHVLGTRAERQAAGALE